MDMGAAHSVFVK